MNERPCYICGTTVDIGVAETYADGSVSYPGLDENRHAFCEPCRALARWVEAAVATWSSSEDRDLFVANAAVEGLRQGRLAYMAEVHDIIKDAPNEPPIEVST